MSKLRKRLNDKEAEFLGFDILESKSGNPKYTLSKKQWQTIYKMRTTPNERKFVETQKKLNKDGEILSTLEKLQSEPIDIPENFEVIKISTSKTTGQQWIQYAPKQEDDIVESIDFDKLMLKYAKPIKLDEVKNKDKTYTFDRLVYTDVHIAMNPNANGFSLYGGKWDEEEIEERLKVMINHTLENKEGARLFIDELGDFMDGWNGETTRKGHALPQNMDNEKAFDVGLGFKIKLIDSLAPHYNEIICNNVCNDNHAGSFGYVVNKASKVFLEHRYNNVKIINHRRFISHYIVDNKCFIITHGKDDKHLKFGFKPILDTKQIEKINNYIDHNNLHKYEIEFSKGDSHQKIFDESTSDKFNYYNYGAFSPSSEWVQTNFKKGKSFFELFNYKKVGEKEHKPYVFKWNINREESVNKY